MMMQHTSPSIDTRQGAIKRPKSLRSRPAKKRGGIESREELELNTISSITDGMFGGVLPPVRTNINPLKYKE